MWPIVVEAAAPRRFLEVGCGLGYTAALMAGAGGAESHVDTIESDPLHAELAEGWLEREGLLDRIRVLRGDAEDVLPSLTGPYDIVFVDGGGPELEAHVPRLIRQRGALVSKAMLRQEVEKIVASINESEGKGEDARQRAHAEAEEQYRNAVTRALVR
jgi:predicted O-methyltransferase YrrM